MSNATPARAAVLLSSGLDSAANLALGPVANAPFIPALALTVNYGQRSAAQELKHAAVLAKYFGIEQLVIDLTSFFPMLVAWKSALLGDEAVPHVGNAHLDDLSVTKKSAKAVWVPNRNGMLLNLAAAAAEARGLDAVVVGFNAEEAVTFPDNGIPFMDAMTAALSFSTANGVKVMSATAPFTKNEIVKRCDDLEFPFELLWSCYYGEDKHCGSCESCGRLRRAITSGVMNPARRAQVLSALFVVA